MKYRFTVLLLLAGSLMIFSGCEEKASMTYFSNTAEETTYAEQMTEQTITKIMVYVCGAVANPGVVEMDSGSRVVDAIGLAGGMTGDADETYLNLAEKLQDGEKVYVPTREEVEQWTLEEQGNTLININTATLEGLCELPGIGESKAADIIAYREKNGPFEAVEDIMKVTGIKLSLYEKIADRICVK